MVVFFKFIGIIPYIISFVFGFIYRPIKYGFVDGYNYLEELETQKLSDETNKEIDKQELELYQQELGTDTDGILDTITQQGNMDTAGGE